MSFDWTLAVFFFLVVGTACTGVFFRPGDWYQHLRKPSWTPPNWLFGPVWSVLYIMIAIAGWLAWRADATLSVWFWGIQLVLNGSWSALFFGLRRMDLGLVDVTLLWLSVATFIIVTSYSSSGAALLFVPYLIWVTIAGALNWRVWRMNMTVA